MLKPRVQRKFRLTSSNEFQRVRRYGKSYAHPLLVLVALSRPLDEREEAVSTPSKGRATPRVGVAAGRSIGNAVQRNRAKRLLRAAIQPSLAAIDAGWDLVLIARKPLLEANFQDIRSALLLLLKRAQLLQESHVD